MSTAMQEWPRRHRLKVGQYHRMAAAGLFQSNERVELISGEIIDVPPIGSLHASVVAWLGERLAAAVAGRAMIRSQLPVLLGDDSEPLPDVAVVVATEDYYAPRHPIAADALLLIEVSDTTLRYDREVKASLYARHSVPEVWIVDLHACVVHCYRAPVSGAYTVIRTEDRRVELSSLPGVAIDLAALERLRPAHVR